MSINSIVNWKKLLVIVLPIALIVSACSDDEGDEPIVLPSNLNVTIVADTVTEGLIHLTASADKANYYSFIFNENGTVTLEENMTGSQSYQYSTSGTYNVVVRAHTTHDKFIEESNTINVTLGSSGGGGGIPTTGYTTPMSYPNLTLVWNDEFDGTSLDTASWNFEIGTGSNGWGNNELQYYREENTSVANGVLTIEAKTELFGGSSYTSSRLTTENKQSFKYGRIDIRAALPYGQGIWPALWMLGDNFRTVGWPACGEIDIMELVGGTVANGGDNVVFGTVHWLDDATSMRANFGGNNRLNSGIFADEFHVFSIIWDSQKIEWYRDDVKYHTIDISPAALSEFQEKFFFIFNVAVGGDWPGSPNSGTNFPQKMYVDYVRVFQ